MKDEAKKKEFREGLLAENKLPYWFGKFENRLEENEKRGNKNGLFVGDAITIADLKAYFLLSWLTGGILDYIDGAKLLEPCSRIPAFLKKVKEDEKMKKFAEEFAKSQAEYKEKKTKVFKYAGKFVCGSL